MSKPLGFYISVPKSSPDHARLAKLESMYGSFFQSLSEQQLKNFLAYCAAVYSGVDPKIAMSKAYLLREIEIIVEDFDKSILFSFIPFLHSRLMEVQSHD